MGVSMKCKVKVFVCLLLFNFQIYNGNGQTQLFPAGGDTISQKDLSDNDTILKWKQSREFAYMHYLDSLLRKEKNLKADTVSINESGQIKRNKTEEKNNSGLIKILNSLPLKIFFWILAVLFISFISYKLFFKNGIWGKKKNRLITENEEGSFEALEEVSKYDALISEAENKNELNLAIRYLFLKTLRSLTDKGFIDFTADKTNKEYLKEMERNAYYNEFQKLTRNYEYTWYGKFLIDENNYQQLKAAFVSFNEKV
jgi:hypothetical protein